MYERMTNKTIQPEITAIQHYIGETGWTLIQEFETQLNNRYDLNRELRFPFGQSYGWGFKYAHKTKHLCYLFFEKDDLENVIKMIEIKKKPLRKANAPQK